MPNIGLFIIEMSIICIGIPVAIIVNIKVQKKKKRDNK